jgi:hypothetical protein
MIISNERWIDIIAATEVEIARWNDRAAEQGLPDKFSVTACDSDGFSILFTKHSTECSYITERGNRERSTEHRHRMVTREIATGELRAANVVTERGQLIGFKVKPLDPKNWKSLADKSAADAVCRLGLLNFTLNDDRHGWRSARDWAAQFDHEDQVIASTNGQESTRIADAQVIDFLEGHLLAMLRLLEQRKLERARENNTDSTLAGIAVGRIPANDELI